MIVAVQCGADDLDHDQSMRALTSLVIDELPTDATIAYVSQPYTPLDRIKEMNVTCKEVRANYKLHGTAAMDYAISTLMSMADRLIVLSQDGNMTLTDMTVLGYASFYEVPSERISFSYERITVT